MKENGKRYRIPHAFNANCWTEVPEKMTMLYSQRDRWHRGLLQILLFHRRILFNPKGGRLSLFALPYYLLFETVGPFFEFFGYIVLLCSALLGLLNPSVALLLFICAIWGGIIISVLSLFISENEILYFRFTETFLLIGFAVLENFGFRQLMSAFRVFSYIGFIFRNKGWEKLKRRGFPGPVS